MKEIIAKEIVRRIAAEVFTPKPVEESAGLAFRLPSPRTDEEIIECAKRAIALSEQALGDASVIDLLIADIRNSGKFAHTLEQTYGVRKQGQ